MTKGREIQVSVYQDYPGPSQPSAPSASPATAPTGDTITISWSAYAGCPADYAVTGYNVSLVNAHFASGGATVTTTSVQIIADAPGQVEARYTATCGSAGTTPASDPAVHTAT